MHKKINKVESNKKKSEIPSIPSVKLMFKKGIQNNLLTNWKNPIEESNKTHNNKEKINVIHDILKATFFNNNLLVSGIIKSNKIPIKGKINKIFKIFFINSAIK